MKEQLIIFETALLAKACGLHTYLDIANNIYGYNLKWVERAPTYWHVHITFPNEDEFLYAPTQSLLQKWLREKHKIHIEIEYLDEVLPYRCIVTTISNNTEVFISKFHTKYEEALEEGLIEALKLIK